MRTAITFFLFTISVTISSQTTFQKVYGGNAQDDGVDVNPTADGGIMIAGHTRSFGVGSYDFYLIKANSQGDTIWTRTYGRSNDGEWLKDAFQTQDGAYLLCGNAYPEGTGLIKVDQNGNIIWTQSYGFTESSAIQTSDGGYLLCGHNNWTSADSVILIKLNSLGVVSWSKSYFVNGYSASRGIKALEVAGNYLVEAKLYGSDVNLWVFKTNSTGGIIWSKVFAAAESLFIYDFAVAASGEILVAGWMWNTSGNVVVWLVCLASNGTLNWAKEYVEGVSEQKCWAMTTDISGNIYLTGENFLLKLNSAGVPAFSKEYRIDSWFKDISIAADGGILLGGDIEDVHTPSDSSSIFIIKTNNAGSSCSSTALTWTSTSLSLTVTTPTYSIGGFPVSYPYPVLVSSGCIPINDCPVGINENEHYVSASVYPNPFTTSATFTIPAEFADEKNFIYLTDVFGRIVYSANVKGNSFQIDRGELPPGIYIYFIEAGDRVFTGKLLAE
ncbi:MAG TPA: T9SS type A sorting domain-containing protein [Bacteroidia bacterium]|nr:T9SS type A sorting domain-containing protein [Bacteroidia bacterium]